MEIKVFINKNSVTMIAEKDGKEIGKTVMKRTGYGAIGAGYETMTEQLDNNFVFCGRYTDELYDGLDDLEFAADSVMHALAWCGQS